MEAYEHIPRDHDYYKQDFGNIKMLSKREKKAPTMCRVPQKAG